MSTAHTNAKATPINDNDYSCHITAVELHMMSISCCITPLVINSIGADTHTHTHTHTHKHKHTHIHTQHTIQKYLMTLGCSSDCLNRSTSLSASVKHSGSILLTATCLLSNWPLQNEQCQILIRQCVMIKIF